jgi:hypothetical protein
MLFGQWLSLLLSHYMNQAEPKWLLWSADAKQTDVDNNIYFNMAKGSPYCWTNAAELTQGM